MLIHVKVDAEEQKQLNRRSLLRGLGGLTIALPTFASLAPRRAWAATQTAPKRALFWWFPDGIKEADKKANYDEVLSTSSGGINWFPAGTETEWTPINLAAPLAKVKSDVIMFRGLDHPNWPTVGCPHDAGPRFSLTSFGDTSIDQVIAKRMTTRFRSLELGIGTWELEREDSRISYLAGKAMPPQQDPNVVFRRLFSEPATSSPDATAAIDLLRKRRASVLDSVKQEIQSTASKLSASDKQRLDFYAQSVRDLETSLSMINGQMVDALAACKAPKLNTGITSNVVGGEKTGGHTPLFDKIAEAQMNIAVLALQCDQTRVVSLMFEKARSDQKYNEFLPLKTNYRGGGSHHFAHGWMETPVQTEAWDLIHTWRTDRFAAMAQKLKDAPDVDGSNLLYNSVLVKTSEIATGAHSYTDIPIVLAGNAGGAIRTGRYLNFAKPGTRQRTSSLWLGVARAMDVNLPSFPEDGNKTYSASTPLQGLLG